MRIKKKTQYQAIFFLSIVLLTLQIFTFENRLFWAYFYSSNEYHRKIKRKLTPGYVTKFSDICDLQTKDAKISFSEIIKQNRKLSVVSNDEQRRKVVHTTGACHYPQAEPLKREDASNIHGILLASYPTGAMRLAWQHVQGLTGLQIQDDFEECDGHHEAFGIVKTQYPHLEGVWSWGANLKNVIYVMENPRWAIPSYQTLLHEIDYAHDCEAAKELLDNVFTFRPPKEKWERWRDYRIKDEIKLYEWHIDYWMGNGTVFWQDWDFERNGQWPFRWLTTEEKAVREKDLNCQYQNIDCVPKVVVSYERLANEATGPAEANKMAEFLENKQGLNIVPEEERECMWHATMEHKYIRNNFNRPGSSKEYGFTYSQMQMIQEMLQRVVTKYSSDQWIENQVAQDIVQYATYYLNENQNEMNGWATHPPTRAPDAAYEESLKEWYNSIGRGDRYNKAKVQNMYGFWKFNSHLYDNVE